MVAARILLIIRWTQGSMSPIFASPLRWVGFPLLVVSIKTGLVSKDWKLDSPVIWRRVYASVGDHEFIGQVVKDEPHVANDVRDEQPPIGQRWIDFGLNDTLADLITSTRLVPRLDLHAEATRRWFLPKYAATSESNLLKFS